MNDKTKHRIVGIVVIAAFLVILLPVLLKNGSNDEVKTSQYAPNERPVTAMVEPVSSASVESEPFETSQVAHVSLDQPGYNESTEQAMTSASSTVTTPSHDSMESMESIESSTSAQTTQPATVVQPAPQPVAPPPQPQPQPKPQPAPKPIPAPPKPKPVQKTVVVAAPAKPKPVIIKTTEQLTNVCFRLGTFSNPNNAATLVRRLKAKGFAETTAVTIVLPNGQTVKRVSYCKAMTRGEILRMRAKLALLVGTSPIVTR
jgi:cell division septation protein DedD